MSDFPLHLRRQLIPNGCRRAPWHDYRGRCIYMITLNAAAGIPPFSILKGIPGNRDWPPVVINTQLGEIIASKISALKEEFPFIKILRRVIMPEHIHFVIFIENETDIHLGGIIAYLKKSCTRQYALELNNSTEGNRKDAISIFEDGYHDRILIKKNQLKRILDYVSDNPRRRLIRIKNPGFHRRIKIRMIDGREYEAYGNASLLTDPDIEAVKISRRYSEDELRKLKICWIRTIENCGVLVSPFISRDEKKVLNWAANNGGRLIYIIDNEIGERFTPKGMLNQICSEGRLLIVGITTYHHSKIPLSRACCEAMNELAIEISSGNFSFTICNSSQ